MEYKAVTPMRYLVATCFALASTGVFAEDIEKSTPDAMLLAGEIILGPVKAGGSNAQSAVDAKSSASRQKRAARDYRKEQDTAAPELVVVPEEESGILSPRQVPSGSDASENVTRARAARQGDTGGTVVLPSSIGGDGVPHAEESAAAASARRNRAKASEYRTGDRGGTGVAIKGSDGLPTVDCSNVDNVSGRIGDDTRSGSVITLIQGSNQVKVRCR